MFADSHQSDLPRQPGAVMRFWDPLTAHWTAKLLPGEHYVTRAAESIVTVLGACVAACVRDPHSGIGGMNHFMLPAERGCCRPATCAHGNATLHYGVEAMDVLLDDLFSLGARREHLEVKLFGAARVMQSWEVTAPTIACVRRYAARHGLNIAAEDLGGTTLRHVAYFPQTGRIVQKELRVASDPVIAESERKYRAAMIAS